MEITSISLLDRAARNSEPKAWDELCELYVPYLHTWIARYNVQSADTDDLIQDVLTAMALELPAFRHNGRTGAFRKWLRTILAHRLRNFWRARSYRAQTIGAAELEEKLIELADEGSNVSAIWDREHDQFVLARLMDLIRPRFKPTTWQAFVGHMVEGQTAETVAARMGIPLAQVYVAKSRVLNALRQQAAGLVEDS